MRSEPSRRRLLTLGLFALALALRAAYVAECQGTPWEDERALISDCEYYDLRAREIAGGDLVGDAPGFLSPVYCFFVGGVYALCGPSVLAVTLVQAVLGALSVALAHRIGRRVFGEAAGVLAALALCFSGVPVCYEGLLVPTTLVLFLHVLLVWILCRRPPLGRTALAAGAVLGLAVGTKANALLLAPALAGWILLAHRDRTWAARLGGAALLALGTAATIAPVTWRNWAASGHLVLVTTTGGRNLAKGNGPRADGSHTSLDIETVNIRHYLEGDVDVDRAVREDARLRSATLAYVRNNPGRAVHLLARKVLLFFNSMELGIRDNYPFARAESAALRAAFVPFAALSALGMAGALLFGGRDARTGLIALLLASQVASFAIVFVLARYRVVALFALALFGGAALVGALRELRSRRFGVPAATAAIAAVMLAVAGLRLEGFEDPNPPGEQLFFTGEWYLERGRTDVALARFEAAAAATWRFEARLGHLESRARIADCLEAGGDAAAATALRTELHDELMEAFPVRNLELKDRLREKLPPEAVRGPRRRGSARER